MKTNPKYKPAIKKLRAEADVIQQQAMASFVKGYWCDGTAANDKATTMLIAAAILENCRH